jgi:antitoxin component YwqK of YwqJK toxin-antitoxin module
MDDLYYLDGIAYKKFTDVPFTGVVNGFDQISSLVIQGNYKHGKREGPWVTYNANGQLDSKGEYRSGKHEGRWVYYDYYGILIKGLSGVFKNDVKISD